MSSVNKNTEQQVLQHRNLNMIDFNKFIELIETRQHRLIAAIRDFIMIRKDNAQHAGNNVQIVNNITVLYQSAGQKRQTKKNMIVSNRAEM